ncbi:MAG: hypothetical protein WC373_07870 [Smithella sp.]|jgi:lysophospholipase L1-like esterase
MRSVFVQDSIDFLRGTGHPGFERKKWIRRHKENDTIIAIGDSHAYFFSGQEVIRPKKIAYHHGAVNSSENLIPGFSPIHIGPVLAYNANKYRTKTRGREKVDYLIKKRLIERGAQVLFCYGEIDIRNHVVRQAGEQGIAVECVVDKILENYLSFLISMRESGLRVACWAPTPSFPDTEQPNDAFPAYGDETTRNRATLYFNEKLKKLCQQNRLIFVSIAEKLIDEHGRIKQDYFVDGCHLNQKAWSLVTEEQFKFGS